VLLGIGPTVEPIGETSIAILMDLMAKNQGPNKALIKGQWWLIVP